MIYLSGPAICQLANEHRMTVNDRLRRGDYGRTEFFGRVRYATAVAVESYYGLRFTPVQIEAAAASGHGRVLMMETA